MSPASRRLFLAIIAINTLGLALAWFAVGAWPILPCAGLEIFAVAVAFRLVARHDEDYERISVSDDAVVIERQERGVQICQRFNKQWLQLVCRVNGARCDLALRSHGREMRIGNLLSDDGRADLAQVLRQQIRTVAD